MNLKLKISERVQIYANKGMSKNQGAIFEAMGSVVIVDENQTLYGEKARFVKETGDLTLEGNVRLVNPDLTLYGSKIDYNYKKRSISIENARLISPEFKVIAGTIKKINDDEFLTENAEFTTCLDCTESWTIFGKKIRIQLKKYVHISEALVRIKGVDFFYIPYFIFPIKNNRQTGFLLPEYRRKNFRSNIDSNITKSITSHSVKIPFFWAIDQSMDMTLEPTFRTRHGPGGDFEFRKAFNSNSYLKTKVRYLYDDIYDTYQKNPNRYGLMHEMNFGFWKNANFHLKLQNFSDLDFYYEHNDFSQVDVVEENYGLSTFFDYRSEVFNIGTLVSMKKSFLSDKVDQYDTFLDFNDNTVNLLPKIYLTTTPFKVFNRNSKFLRYMNTSSSLKLSNFSQDSPQSLGIIRNAKRVNFNNDLNLEVLNPGSYRVDMNYSFDAQKYFFDKSISDDFFKYSGVLDTSFSIDLGKVYGKASKKIKSNLGSQENSEGVIGYLEKLDLKKNEQIQFDYQTSIKHLQTIKFSHFYIPFEKESGNANFKNQINSTGSLFDMWDAVRSTEHLLGQEYSRTQMPFSNNTVALFWNHSLIRKKYKKASYQNNASYPEDNFHYQKLAYLNLSQGYQLNENSGFTNDLTRLGSEFGYYFTPKFNLKLENYYFYDSEQFIGDITLKNDFGNLKLLNRYSYNGFSQRKLYSWGVDLVIRKNFIASVYEGRNFSTGSFISRKSTLQYLGDNNCWYLAGYYLQRPKDDSFGIDFNINFGDGKWENNNVRRIY